LPKGWTERESQKKEVSEEWEPVARKKVRAGKLRVEEGPRKAMPWISEQRPVATGPAVCRKPRHAGPICQSGFCILTLGMVYGVGTSTLWRKAGGSAVTLTLPLSGYVRPGALGPEYLTRVLWSPW
jgi:hypothetical protein